MRNVESGIADERSFRVPLRNAKFLRRSSVILAEAGRFGPAVALLVLASEEVIKAMLAFCKAKGLDLDPAGAKESTKSHQTRLRMSKALLTVAKYSEDVVKKYGEDASFEKLLASTIEQLIRDFSTESVSQEILDMRCWWENANSLKQRGLYADFIHGQWLTPDSISRSDYEQAKEMVDPLVQGARITLASSKKSALQFLKNLDDINLDSLMLRMEAEIGSFDNS